DPLDLMSEVEQVLGIDTVPLDWPIGSGKGFLGVFDRLDRKVHLFKSGKHGTEIVAETILELDDPGLEEALGDRLFAKLHEDLELLDAAGEPFSLERFLAGELTPVFFGSAATNFGIGPFLDRFVSLAPGPGPRETVDGGSRDPQDPAFSAFVFKIQANMDASHRDRLCFVRVCSGRYEKGMKVRHARLGKEIRLAAAHTLLGRDRIAVEDAFAGDIIGLVD